MLASLIFCLSLALPSGFAQVVESVAMPEPGLGGPMATVAPGGVTGNTTGIGLSAVGLGGVLPTLDAVSIAAPRSPAATVNAKAAPVTTTPAPNVVVRAQGFTAAREAPGFPSGREAARSIKETSPDIPLANTEARRPDAEHPGAAVLRAIVQDPEGAEFDGSVTRRGLAETFVEARAAVRGPRYLGPAEPGGAHPGGSVPPEPAKPSGFKRRLAFVPNLITGLNLASGLAAMLAASGGSVAAAAGFIILANVFDAFDGRAARALGVTGPMGIELDSLADVVSFGAAPAILIYKAALVSLGPVGFALAAAFAFGGAYRLARFNIGAQREAADPVARAAHKDAFTGLPIPGGAGVVAAAALALSVLPAAAGLWLAAGATAVAAAAMVSRLPYPAFKQGGPRALALPAAVGAVLLLILGSLGLWALVPAALFGAYLATGPAAYLLERSKTRR